MKFGTSDLQIFGVPVAIGHGYRRLVRPEVKDGIALEINRHQWRLVVRGANHGTGV